MKQPSLPPLSTRFRLLGLLPLTFFCAHLLYYTIEKGRPQQMLWMCNLSNLVLAVGLLSGRRFLIRLAVIWLIPAFPLWLYEQIVSTPTTFTTFLVHPGSLTVGLIALYHIRATRGLWWLAALWGLVVQQVCRLTTQSEENINVAFQAWHLCPKWFETSYGLYFLLISLIAALALWAVERLLLCLFPPHAPPA